MKENRLLREQVKEYKEDSNVMRELLVNYKAEITVLRNDLTDYKANEMAMLSQYHRRGALHLGESEVAHERQTQEKEGRDWPSCGGDRSRYQQQLEQLDRSIEEKREQLANIEASESRSGRDHIVNSND